MIWCVGQQKKRWEVLNLDNFTFNREPGAYQPGKEAVMDMSRFKREDVDLDRKIEYLSSPKVEEQREAALFLGENCERSEKAVEALIKCLASTQEEELLHALVWALGETGNERAVEPLIAKFSSTSIELLRRDIAMSLEQIGGQRTIEFLLELLTDKSQWVRRASVEAMGCLKVRRAKDALIALLSDESEYVRSAAAEALGKVCRLMDKDAIEFLSLVLGRTSEDENVRAEAESAILRIRRRN